MQLTLYILLITTIGTSAPSRGESNAVYVDHALNGKHEVVAVCPDRKTYLHCKMVTQANSSTRVLDVRAILQYLSENVLEGVMQRKEPAPDIRVFCKHCSRMK